MHRWSAAKVSDSYYKYTLEFKEALESAAVSVGKKWSELVTIGDTLYYNGAAECRMSMTDMLFILRYTLWKAFSN